MPTYEFKCGDCDNEISKIMSITEYSKPQEHICECGAEMLRRFSCPSIHDNCPGFCGRNKD